MLKVEPNCYRKQKEMGKWLLMLEAVISIVLPVLGVLVEISLVAGTGIGFAVLLGTFFYTDRKIEEFVGHNTRDF